MRVVADEYTAVSAKIEALYGQPPADYETTGIARLGREAPVTAVLLTADRLDDAQRLAEDLTRTGTESGSVLLALAGLMLQANILHRRGALADATPRSLTATSQAVTASYPNYRLA